MEANQRFGAMVLSHYSPGDMVWVQDYHLMLLPQILKGAHAKMKARGRGWLSCFGLLGCVWLGAVRSPLVGPSRPRCEALPPVCLASLLFWAGNPAAAQGADGDQNRAEDP